MRHSIAVVKVATDEPKESSECLRTPDANVQVLFHLREKFVEDAREVAGGRSVRGDGFSDQFKPGPFPTADPCVCLYACYAAFVAHDQAVRKGQFYASGKLMRRVSSVDVGAERHGMDTLALAEVNVIVHVPYRSSTSAILGGPAKFICACLACAVVEDEEGTVGKGRPPSRE